MSKRHNKRIKVLPDSFFLFLILKLFDLNFAFLYTIPKLFNFDWLKKWNDFTCLDATMINICLDDVTKKFVVCDGSDNFLRWLFLDLRWSCMTVGPLTIWSNYRPKMTDYPSFLHSSSTRLEFTPQKNIAKFYWQKLWDYKSLQKSNLIHNFNFCPNLIFWIHKLKIEF